MASHYCKDYSMSVAMDVHCVVTCQFYARDAHPTVWMLMSVSVRSVASIYILCRIGLTVQRIYDMLYPSATPQYTRQLRVAVSTTPQSSNQQYSVRVSPAAPCCADNHMYTRGYTNGYRGVLPAHAYSLGPSSCGVQKNSGKKLSPK